MDMPQYMAMTQQTIQEFAAKMAHFTLTEYEMLCYEASCQAVTMYHKIQEMNLRREMIKWLKDNPKWEEGEEQDDSEGGDSTPTDG